MTAGQPRWNETGRYLKGSIFGLNAKKHCQLKTLRERAKKALRRQVANGIQVVRSHVDVTDPQLTAFKGIT